MDGSQRGGRFYRLLCSQRKHASAVFLGQVIASETLSDGSTRTRFDVKEAFKGVSATEVVVNSVGAPMLSMMQYIFVPGTNA